MPFWGAHTRLLDDGVPCGAGDHIVGYCIGTRCPLLSAALRHDGWASQCCVNWVHYYFLRIFASVFIWIIGPRGVSFLLCCFCFSVNVVLTHRKCLEEFS